MVGINLKHVERFKDRRKQIRYYFRKGKGKRLAINGQPGTLEFQTSYWQASAQYEKRALDATGSFNELIKRYYASSTWLKNKASTRKVQSYTIDKFADVHGNKKVKQMTRSDVEEMFAEKSATPAAANTFLKMLRALMKFAIQNELAKYDPTLHFDMFKTGTHYTWNEADIAKYEKRWPVGSRERLAFDLHLYTGQRRGDVSRMKWTDYANHKIKVAQEKSDAEAQDEFIIIPAHKSLKKSIASVKQNGEMIISTAKGLPYVAQSYGNWMADNIEKASLPPKCVLHGLRKASARRLAECGCTPHQIAAITGHKTLAEVERYTRAVSQGKLADQAMTSLGKSEFS